MGQIVNQQLMANLAVEFNVGVDILSKGNRTIEKELGASNMSGDTVSVTIMDSGKVFQNSLDLSGLRGTLAVKRASVPLSVAPIGIAAEASEGELALAIEKPDIMAKRVANLQDEVNKKAYRAIVGSCQPYAFDPTGLNGDQYDRAVRKVSFRAEAHSQTSKLAGNIFGIAHPQTWNEVVPTLHANFGNNPKNGTDLYKNELGDYMGLRWTKGVDTLRIEAQDVAAVVTSISVGLDGKVSAAISGIGTGDEEGEIYPMPLYLTDDKACADGLKHKVECVDALGKPTGIQKAVYFKWHFDTWQMTPGYGWQGTSGHWELAQPLFLAGPRKNAHSRAYEEFLAAGSLVLDRHGFIQPDYDWYAQQTWNRNPDYVNGGARDPEASGYLTFTTSNVLTDGFTYLAPMAMFHEQDFLIAVKGIEKMSSADSFTIPTEFRDKGILPLRGTYWTDPYTSLGLFRVDTLMGFGMYQGVSGACIYIPEI
jgi:hypothetical protein